jgi:endonuclease/exonuclease/phosphatase family metal-dependent hydrolase
MSTLTVTTWNVQNLFRPGTSPTAGRDAEDTPEARSRYKTKLGELARAIRELAPDVIALQEVGGDAALTDLQRAVGADLYDHRAVGEPDARGICCAFLSKTRFEVQPHDLVTLPPNVLAVGLRDLDDRPLSRMGRGALHIRVRRGTRELDLINTHLKSKLLTFPGGKFSTDDETLRARVATQALARRAAEAAAVRTWATALRQERRPLLLLGDLNDAPHAATTQILQGPSGSALGTRGFDQPDRGDPQRLWNLSSLIPEARRFTRVHHGTAEVLDQILASEELVAEVERVDARVEGLRSIGDDPSKEREEVWPDHAAVTAWFG